MIQQVNAGLIEIDLQEAIFTTTVIKQTLKNQFYSQTHGYFGIVLNKTTQVIRRHILFLLGNIWRNHQHRCSRDKMANMKQRQQQVKIYHPNMTIQNPEPVGIQAIFPAVSADTALEIEDICTDLQEIL
jgi:hypothetical protein